MASTTGTPKIDPLTAARLELDYCTRQAARRDLSLRQRASYLRSASAAHERIETLTAKAEAEAGQ